MIADMEASRKTSGKWERQKKYLASLKLPENYKKLLRAREGSRKRRAAYKKRQLENKKTAEIFRMRCRANQKAYRRRKKMHSSASSSTNEWNDNIISNYECGSVAQEFVTVKIEPDDEFNITSCDYCRCCFKMLDVVETKHSADDQSLNTLIEITQLNLQPSHLASKVCDECVRNLKQFNNFRMLTIAKQNKFLEIIQNENLEELKDLHKLTLMNVTHVNLQPVVKLERINIPVISEKYLKLEESDLTITTQEIFSTPLNDQKNKRNPTKIKCPLCETRFLKEHALKRHIFRYHAISCEHCEFKAVDQASIDKHIKSKHIKIFRKNVKPNKCPICKKMLKLDMERHIRKVHQKIKNCFCDLCGFGVFHKFAMRQHMLSQHLPKKLKCNECEYVTAKKKLLKLHYEARHNRKKSTVNCLLCGKFYKNEKVLETHIQRVHERVKNFSCDICDRKFFKNNELKAHKLHNHSSRADFICDACGKAYFSEKLLKVHVQIHEGKSFICDMCGKSFATKPRLQIHVKFTHLRIKNHVCDVCGKCFICPSKLHIHKLEHSGIRFPCFVPGCGSSFTRKDAALFHVRKNHRLTQEEFKTWKENLDEFSASLKSKLQ
ncbi:CLUMA_CG017181, isoform A [Clunio marinus]|uniref:CLUMA_CG017181, isoform A n=1 Tax=Clunio marinus TaxID=568069 RepID=A0A1J1IUZ1_9DIPT|nr:CLUMA_CG017181, isoform A [Clunio marinus]